MASEDEIRHAMMHGLSFKGAGSASKNEKKVKTKARGKAYHTGAHNSGAAKYKAEIRQRVKNRRSQRKG